MVIEARVAAAALSVAAARSAPLRPATLPHAALRRAAFSICLEPSFTSNTRGFLWCFRCTAASAASADNSLEQSPSFKTSLKLFCVPQSISAKNGLKIWGAFDRAKNRKRQRRKCQSSQPSNDR